jgi:hypothetical protein
MTNNKGYSSLLIITQNYFWKNLDSMIMLSEEHDKYQGTTI